MLIQIAAGFYYMTLSFNSLLKTTKRLNCSGTKIFGQLGQDYARTGIQGRKCDFFEYKKKDSESKTSSRYSLYIYHKNSEFIKKGTYRRIYQRYLNEGLCLELRVIRIKESLNCFIGNTIFSRKKLMMPFFLRKKTQFSKSKGTSWISQGLRALFGPFPVCSVLVCSEIRIFSLYFLFGLKVSSAKWDFLIKCERSNLIRFSDLNEASSLYVKVVRTKTE